MNYLYYKIIYSYAKLFFRTSWNQIFINSLILDSSCYCILEKIIIVFLKSNCCVFAVELSKSFPFENRCIYVNLIIVIWVIHRFFNVGYETIIKKNGISVQMLIIMIYIDWRLQCYMKNRPIECQTRPWQASSATPKCRQQNKSVEYI